MWRPSSTPPSHVLPLVQPLVVYVAPQDPHYQYQQSERDRIYHQNRMMFERENAYLRHTLAIEQQRCLLVTTALRNQHKRKRLVTSSVVPLATVSPVVPLATVPPVALLDAKQIEGMLSTVFGALFTLKDILRLADHPDRSSLETNPKFARLLRVVEPVRALDNLVGLESIKAKAFEIIAHYALNETPRPADLMHMVIEGPPGVGKTEVGRLLGKVILGLGVLPTDKFICARRSDLIGEYLGQTAPRTQAVIDSALGGILFIDEAYSLGNPEKRDSFSKECIDTLNQNLTEKKGQFLCIIAGYAEELDACFFAVNRGLQRRFPVRMTITGYTPKELHAIFLLKVAQDQWLVDTPDIAMKLFVDKHAYFHFAAGDTETLFYQAKFAAAGRLLRSNTAFATQPTLCTQDVAAAYQHSLQNREKAEAPRLDMYN